MKTYTYSKGNKTIGGSRISVQQNFFELGQTSYGGEKMDGVFAEAVEIFFYNMDGRKWFSGEISAVSALDPVTKGFVLTLTNIVLGTEDEDDGYFRIHLKAGGSAIVVPHPLNAHTDVNVPAPNNGDVLTYDSGGGEWIATSSGGVDRDLVRTGDSVPYNFTSSESFPSTAGNLCFVESAGNTNVTTFALADKIRIHNTDALGNSQVGYFSAINVNSKLAVVQNGGLNLSGYFTNDTVYTDFGTWGEFFPISKGFDSTGTWTEGDEVVFTELGASTLNGLSDVNLGATPATGSVMYYDGSEWVNTNVLSIDPAGAKVATFTGSIDVTGAVDPTGVEFIPQASVPAPPSVGSSANTVWIDSGDSKLKLGSNEVLTGTSTIGDIGGVTITGQAKGDLLVANSGSAIVNLPVGTDGQVLEADSAEATGVKWATPAGAVVSDSHPMIWRTGRPGSAENGRVYNNVVLGRVYISKTDTSGLNIDGVVANINLGSTIKLWSQTNKQKYAYYRLLTSDVAPFDEGATFNDWKFEYQLTNRYIGTAFVDGDALNMSFVTDNTTSLDSLSDCTVVKVSDDEILVSQSGIFQNVSHVLNSIKDCNTAATSVRRGDRLVNSTFGAAQYNNSLGGSGNTQPYYWSASLPSAASAGGTVHDSGASLYIGNVDLNSVANNYLNVGFNYTGWAIKLSSEYDKSIYRTYLLDKNFTTPVLNNARFQFVGLIAAFSQGSFTDGEIVNLDIIPSGVNQFNQLFDANTPSPVTGDQLYYFSSKWVNRSTNDGQIKINNGNSLQPTFIGLTTVQEVTYASPLGVSSFPTSSPPLSVNGGVFLDSHIYDFTAGAGVGKFLENQELGQINIWRIILDYSNKSVSNSGVIEVSLRNPLSGFQAKASFALPQGLTGETDRYSEIITIADGASLQTPLGTGNGYIMEIFSTTSVDVTITSITRINTQYTPRS